MRLVPSKKLDKIGEIPEEITEFRPISAEKMLEIRASRGDFTGRAGVDGSPGRDGVDGKSGADGRDGQRGLVGERGHRGKNGERGERGERGAEGKRGLPGRDGIDGKSAYEVWRASGRRGSVAEFIESLKVQGVQGPDGDPGERGPEGPAGPRGPMPKHEWKNGLLRFENPDGSWGQWQDLQGAVYFGTALGVQTAVADPLRLGYIFVQDASHTSTNPFLISANTRVAIPIDGMGPLTSYTTAPAEAQSWWNTDTFQPSAQSEFYELRFNMFITPIANGQNFTAELDIGTPNTVWSQTSAFNKNAGEAAKYSFVIPTSVGAAFIKGGAKFYIKPTCDVAVYSTSVLIHRSFKL